MGAGHERGRLGEELVAHHFEERGWRILDRNWRSGHAELDLVIQRDSVVAFVEVKTRSRPGCGDPLESVTWRKRREIERLAGAWLATRGRTLGARFEVRFDAVAVELAEGNLPTVRHVADAWWIGDP